MVNFVSARFYGHSGRGSLEKALCLLKHILFRHFKTSGFSLLFYKLFICNWPGAMFFILFFFRGVGVVK